MRCRSMFYTSLGRLLMVDLGEDEDKFDAFMLPLTTAFESLGAVLAAGGYNSEEVTGIIIMNRICSFAVAVVCHLRMEEWLMTRISPIIIHF